MIYSESLKVKLFPPPRKKKKCILKTFKKFIKINNFRLKNKKFLENKNTFIF